MRSYCSSKSGLRFILYVAFIIESTTAIGGILGLRALTGNAPYYGPGNPWITYPTVSHGGAGLYSPYFPWGHGGVGGYGSRGFYHPYQAHHGVGFPYLPYLSAVHGMARRSTNVPTRTPSVLPTVSSAGGGYYKGRGNAFVATPH